MKKIIIILAIAIIAIPLQAQDITNKLGGNTANETYDVTDSGDNLLFRVQGDGKVKIGSNSTDGKLSVETNSSNAIYGYQSSSTGSADGVFGETSAPLGAGVTGIAGPTGANFGGHFSSSAMEGTGVFGAGHKYGGHFKSTTMPNGIGLFAEGSQFAGAFVGNVIVTGSVTARSFLYLEDDLQAVDAGSTVTPTTSYMKLSPGITITLNATTAIADGTEVGQILFIENISVLYDITIPNNANTKIGSDKTLLSNQMFQLLWSGTDWVMPNI